MKIHSLEPKRHAHARFGKYKKSCAENDGLLQISLCEILSRWLVEREDEVATVTHTNSLRNVIVELSAVSVMK